LGSNLIRGKDDLQFVCYPTKLQALGWAGFRSKGFYGLSYNIHNSGS